MGGETKKKNTRKVKTKSRIKGEAEGRDVIEERKRRNKREKKGRKIKKKRRKR